MIDQLIIMLTGIVAIWLLNDSREHVRRWGCIVGLIGQPAWLWATWTGQQWGMLVATIGFTLAYLRGLWALWLRPRIDVPLSEDGR